MSGIPGHSDLLEILSAYQKSFVAKAYADENDDHDPLMDVFGILPALKRENRQYWGRELGMCWQRLVIALSHAAIPSRFRPGVRQGDDELCDLVINSDAIDTKYRIGSGDAGTLKKLKAYGEILRRRHLEPVMLIVRTDNLPAAIGACKVGGWTILEGATAFQYLQKKTGIDLEQWLHSQRGKFHVERSG